MSQLRAIEGGRVKPGLSLANRFQLEAHLGTGGLGDLYRVRAVGSSERFALRMTELTDAPAVLDAMRGVGSLNERFSLLPIARVRSSGADEGRMWYAMDFVEGESLLSLVRRAGPMAPKSAAALLVQVAEAVATLHDEDVVHQNLNARTIMSDGGSAAILELGVTAALARLIQEKPGVLATPNARAPEQLIVADASPQADVYALGAILHYLVTGRKAIPEGATGLQLAIRGGVRPPKLDAVAPEVRPILARALALRPQDRFPSAHEFAAALWSIAGEP